MATNLSEWQADNVNQQYSMTAERYLGEHHIFVYLEDSISQLLSHREENPKVNALKYLGEYLRDGNHTMFRNYAFIKATPHNRASFIRLFWKSFSQIGLRGDLLSIKEYHSLVQLLCPDFPMDLLLKAARVVLMDDALDCLISFSDFLYAFQVQFYYEVFLDKATEIYKSLEQSQNSPREAVVVPSSTDDSPSVKYRATLHTQDTVDSAAFFRMLYQMCDKAEFSVPPRNILKELLDVASISYYSFLMFIAKSQAINEAIGQLPKKVDLLEGMSRELNNMLSPGLQGNPSKKSNSSTASLLTLGSPRQSQKKGASKGVRVSISNTSRHKIRGNREVGRREKVQERSSSSDKTSVDSDGSTTD